MFLSIALLILVQGWVLAAADSMVDRRKLVMHDLHRLGDRVVQTGHRP